MWSLREAVIAGSSCRSDPAAAFLGIGEDRLAFLLASAIEFGEVLLGHVDLAPHLEQGRGALRWSSRSRKRQRPDGLEVLGDILAGVAVAAGRALNEEAVAIDRLNGKAVELGLGHVLDAVFSRIFLTRLSNSSTSSRSNAF